jgi:hypothetical protein
VGVASGVCRRWKIGVSGWQAEPTLVFRRVARCRRARFAPLAKGPTRVADDSIGLQNWPAPFGAHRCEPIFAVDPQNAIGGAGGDALNTYRVIAGLTNIDKQVSRVGESTSFFQTLHLGPEEVIHFFFQTLHLGPEEAVHFFGQRKYFIFQTLHKSVHAHVIREFT